jgi:hypothetical protein
MLKQLKTLVVFFAILCITTGLFAYERDWEANPPWLEITGAVRICAIGDIHGAFDEFAATLEHLKVAKRISPESFRFKWIGRSTVLVLVGDLTDRGLYSKQVYDAVMDLQQQAPGQGGQVVVTVGNHEAMMLNGQVEDWANNLTSYKKQHYQNTIDSFTRDGLNYRQAISEEGLYGKWIRNLPLFAIVNGFMFVHAGLPNTPVSRSSLAADFRDDVTIGDWKIGLFMNHDQVIWNRGWWKNDDLVSKNLKVLGIMGVVFGHTIGALGKKGIIDHKNSRIISIDVGMTPAYGNSKGGGLVVTTTQNGLMIFRAVYPDRPDRLLFSVRMPASAYRERALGVIAR